jgi:hypothetical protein
MRWLILAPRIATGIELGCRTSLMAGPQELPYSLSLCDDVEALYSDKGSPAREESFNLADQFVFAGRTFKLNRLPHQCRNELGIDTWDLLNKLCRSARAVTWNNDVLRHGTVMRSLDRCSAVTELNDYLLPFRHKRS